VAGAHDDPDEQRDRGEHDHREQAPHEAVATRRCLLP
jgi:hypothetical protein